LTDGVEGGLSLGFGVEFEGGLGRELGFGFDGDI
jgi:hypothetical protein